MPRCFLNLKSLMFGNECTNSYNRNQIGIICASVANYISNLKTNTMKNFIAKEKTYEIIGTCMEVHNNLGAGFLEIVYKDALEYEFRNAGIPYKREKEYAVNYKGVILPHKFYADFVVFDNIVLEVKGASSIANEHIAQAINYLKVSQNRVVLLVNFGEIRLNYKRLIL